MIKVSIKVLTLLAKLNLRRESQLHPFISKSGNSKFREIERKSAYFEWRIHMTRCRVILIERPSLAIVNGY